jgi:hypothetical protein
MDEPKPAYITLDVAQLRRPNERLALRESGMNLVFLKAGMQQVPFDQMVAKMVLSWKEIVTVCQRATAPTVFEVGSGLNPKVNRVGLTADLK